MEETFKLKKQRNKQSFFPASGQLLPFQLTEPFHAQLAVHT